MNAQRVARLLAQARESHRRRVADEVVPTWRETLRTAVMALALMLALAFLLTVGSD